MYVLFSVVLLRTSNDTVETTIATSYMLRPHASI